MSTVQNFKLPDHLKKYIVQQDYSKYTALDQAVWRYCLRQLKDFLLQNGHHCYADGLAKTGISVEYIPRISEMSACLQKFGWIAMPVSGFIPPAAFMELQSLGVLPIACDMRTVDHLLYTPAPDIVHEAAGHAPIIVDEEYADYLKQYSQVAKKSIISKEDIDLYEAIRDLSDTKENPNSSHAQISLSEKKLTETIQKITHTSEASQLSRMNWWTAEYGLIGDIKNPKIFGAGLLSSVGESKWCLSDKVKKIPLTIDCINQNYDITEPQPQLFVTPDFKTLVHVLNEFSKTMAYKQGGTTSLDKLLKAQSVNTAELDSGFQISGVLENYLTSKSEVIFLKFKGSTQLSLTDKKIDGHGIDYHQHGYSSPLGKFNATSLKINTDSVFNYESGFKISGCLTKVLALNVNAVIYSFKNATMTYDGKVFFQPDWGTLDIITGSKIVSAYGGPADRDQFGLTDDFVATKVPSVRPTEEQMKLYSLYQKIRDIRTEQKHSDAVLNTFFQECMTSAKNEWLLFVEILELAQKNNFLEIKTLAKQHLEQMSAANDKIKSVIEDGIRLAHA